MQNLDQRTLESNELTKTLRGVRSDKQEEKGLIMGIYMTHSQMMK